MCLGEQSPIHMVTNFNFPEKRLIAQHNSICLHCGRSALNTDFYTVLLQMGTGTRSQHEPVKYCAAHETVLPQSFYQGQHVSLKVASNSYVKCVCLCWWELAVRSSYGEDGMFQRVERK